MQPQRSHKRSNSHSTPALLLRHRWSNTLSRQGSSTRIGHVSLPYNRTARTIALYTPPFRLRPVPLWRHRWPRVAKVILAFELHASILFYILNLVLTQLSRCLKLFITSRISPWSSKGVFRPITSWIIILHFDAAKYIPLVGITVVIFVHYPLPLL